MIGGILLSVLCAIVVMLAYFTWLERYVTRGEPFSSFAWLSGFLLAALVVITGIAFTLDW